MKPDALLLNEVADKKGRAAAAAAGGSSRIPAARTVADMKWGRIEKAALPDSCR